MKDNKKTLDNLLDKTSKHVQKKKYLYKPKIAKRNKEGKEIKKYGKVLYKNITPTPHKNILLSIAMNIALENYQNIRGAREMKAPLSMSKNADMLLRFFSKKFYDKIGNAETLIDENQNYEYKAIEAFANIEYKIFAVVDRLRNYHSHYVHEPGVLTFEDYFNNNHSLKQKDLDEVKVWFKDHFDKAKNHLIRSLSERKEKLSKDTEQDENKIKNKIEEIDSALETFKKHIIFYNKQKRISLNAQLFIASMFLYKRQLKIILEKWRGFRLDKDIKGYENTIHTFFSYYTMSENYSLNNYNDNLLKFRDITSKLTTIPVSSHEKLQFIYEKIREINEENYKEINEKIEHEIEEAEKIKNNIMPLRNRNILTKTLLQYLLDNNLFNANFKIAINKTLTDRLEYFEKHTLINEGESLTAIKNRKKEKNGLPKEEREQLNEHYKELKRNFIFKTPGELAILAEEPNENKEDELAVRGYNFSIKKKNALVQYTYKVKNKPDIIVNITLSSQLLLKWVFTHLETGENKGVESIENFIRSKISKLSIFNIDSEKLVTEYEKNNKIPLSKILPRGILKATGHRKQAYTAKEKIEANIKAKINRLELFSKENLHHPKPWKYKSKEKIDVILNYMHYKLLFDTYLLKKCNKKTDTETFIRHNYFNVDTYNIAREYFRFFGRYKKGTISNLAQYKLKEFATPKSITILKEKYKTIFKYLEDTINEADSLEDLFKIIIGKHIKHLEILQKEVEKYKVEDLEALLKIDKTQEKSHTDKLLSTHYLNSFALGDEIIQVKNICKEQWNTFKVEKEKLAKKQNREFRYTEYAFIRNWLQGKDQVKTNIDYIYKHILPQTDTIQKNKKVPNQVSRQLLKLKTEELVLWNIAKSYWEKANGSAYDLEKLGEQQEETSSYQLYTSFNKVYKQKLDYKITIFTKFWSDKNKSKFKVLLKKHPNITKEKFDIKIKVPAKRYDNLFLKVETQLISEYVLWNHYEHYNPKEKCIVLPKEHPYIKTDGKIRMYNLQEFDELIKVIYKDLKKSLNNIGDLLRAEKRIVENRLEIKDALIDKYKGKEKITSFYLGFNKTLLNEFLKESNQNNLDNIRDYMISFRNNALHYQLQDPERKKAVQKLLEKINKDKQLNIDECDTKEN